MTCLLVIAHPVNNSLCRSLTGVARAALKSHGVKVTLEDLYAVGFQPALTSAERLSHYGEGSFVVTGDMQRLLAAEMLVLVFPTWWFGFPAILKGWFDRVWAPGVAYDLPTEGKAIAPRLLKLKVVIAITTLGSPRWVDWLVLRQPVKLILKRALIGACAPQAKLHYLALHEAEKVNSQRFEGFATKIRNTIARATKA